MTNDEIRELAKEAGFKWGFIKEQGLMDGMIDFANLVAQQERDACAKEAEGTFYSVQAAENIRARGQA